MFALIRMFPALIAVLPFALISTLPPVFSTLSILLGSMIESVAFAPGVKVPLY